MTAPILAPPIARLDGRIGLVTGASRGLGRACAVALARAGAQVIAVARTASDLQELSAECAEYRIEGWQEDVTNDAFFQRLAALPAIHILVNNAGMNRPQRVENVDLQTLDEMLELNVRSVYRTSQAAARIMLRTKSGGSIIHMSSQMGHVGAPSRTVYCMTKHAVEGLTKALAVELGADGIRVNSIAPTFIDTELTRSMLAKSEFRQFVLGNIPLGKLGTPVDVANAVVFLASDQASMITGTSIKVDGGWTAH